MKTRKKSKRAGRVAPHVGCFSVIKDFEKFQVDTFFPNLYNFHFDFIANLQDFFYAFDTLIAESRNMNEPVLSRCEFAESADLRKNSHDFRYEHIANLGVLRYRKNYRFRALCLSSVAYASYIYSSVVLNIDFNARFLYNLIDYFALLAYDIADLFGVDVKRDYSGAYSDKSDLGLSITSSILPRMNFLPTFA